MLLHILICDKTSNIIKWCIDMKKCPTWMEYIYISYILYIYYIILYCTILYYIILYFIIYIHNGILQVESLLHGLVQDFVDFRLVDCRLGAPRVRYGSLIHVGLKIILQCYNVLQALLTSGLPWFTDCCKATKARCLSKKKVVQMGQGMSRFSWMGARINFTTNTMYIAQSSPST